jgi:flagellum-specific peptidoglycan hydrolase FlgJ
MKDVMQLIRLKIRIWLGKQKRKLYHLFFSNKWKIAGFLLILYIVNKQTINGFIPKITFLSQESKIKKVKTDEAGLLDMGSVIAFVKGESGKAKAQTVSEKTTKSWKDDTKPVAKFIDKNVGNTYSNVSFWGGKNELSDKRSQKRIIQNNYVSRFAKIAQAETGKFAIPTSIILAQGILESNAGGSSLAKNNNNHFGIKCFSRSCAKGHCSNFTDDSHKDFFKIYGSPWQSFRDHSLLLKRYHYRKLFHLNKKDYRSWALGLQQLGYATDKHYAESLIRTIEDLGLQQFD